MKKNITILAMLAALFMTTTASAATSASFSQTQINARPGETFNLIITIDPHGSANYAEKIELKYPADLLEARSFAFGTNWTALNQPGYDSTDNANGIMIKTGGYASGFSSSAVFGTVTFYAKKAGSGTIKIGSGSQAFESNKQSGVTPANASVIVASAVSPTATPNTALSTPKPSPKISGTPPVSSTPSVSLSPTPVSPFTAAASEAGPKGGKTLIIILGIVILAALGATYAFTRKKPRRIR